jgi:hypothetical protein
MSSTTATRSSVPRPAADLLLGWIDNRDNMNTATNRDSRWLFTGRRDGQPMCPDTLAALVNDLGIPTVAARAAAIRQGALTDTAAPRVARAAPAPLAADSSSCAAQMSRLNLRLFDESVAVTFARRGVAMQRVSPRRRTRIQEVLAACSAALAVLAALAPQWIEAFGIDPDQGSGFLEWALPVALAVAAVLLTLAAKRNRRAWRALGPTG